MLLLTELCHYPRKLVTIPRTVLLLPDCDYCLLKCYYLRKCVTITELYSFTAHSGKSQLPILSLSHTNKRQARCVTLSGETGSVTKLFHLNSLHA
jgi:hypothetical protein